MTDEPVHADARRRASVLRYELSRAQDHAQRLRHAAQSYLANAERTARSRGEDPDSHDGRVGAYPRIALWLCTEGFAHLRLRPSVAKSYLAWALAYLEVARADLEGVESMGLAKEHSQAAAWVENQLTVVADMREGGSECA